MKAINITYWITTAIVSVMMTYSAVAYLTDPNMHAAFQHLGFPAYFRIELALAKFLGVIALLAPVSYWIKEWAYAAFVIVFISAGIAHTASGDPAMARLMPLVFLIIHLVSYFTYRTMRFKPAGNGE